MTALPATEADLAARVRAWAAADPDPATRGELLGLLAADDRAALAERFAARLEFGTAGIRGVLGSGPARMNRAVARRVGAGLARVLAARVPDAAARGVAVGHDMRRLSPEMALEICGALAAAGLRVHLLPGPQPTPLLAFAVLELGCAAGVMVTASHNPPQYNGIKVYWDDGIQVVPPIDAEISAALGALEAPISDSAPLPFLDPAEARARGLLLDTPADLAERYLAAIAGQTPPVPWDAAAPSSRMPRIVYTPLHGVALELARRAFAQRGIGGGGAGGGDGGGGEGSGVGEAAVSSGLDVVAAQAAPDGSFPTVALPNPEEAGALGMALAQAAAGGADLVVAHDPDGDRLAAAVRTHAGTFQVLTGDEIGSLLAWQLLSMQRDSGTLRSGSFVVTTVVSSSQLARIARWHGVHCEVTLTGLKWIWHRALALMRRGRTFVFGYEEALGYSVGPAVRDKDGISAAVLLAEMARAAAAGGETLLDRLTAIRTSTGVVLTRPLSLGLPPDAARARVRRVVAQAAAGDPALAPLHVALLADHETGERRDLESGAVTPIDLPPASLVVLETSDGCVVRLRPSGTEPKLKVYLEAAEPPAPRAEIAAAERRAAATLDRLEAAVRALLLAPAAPPPAPAHPGPPPANTAETVA